MANQSDSKSPPSLRKQAEAAWQGRHRDPVRIAPEDANALVHELEVHQIELELQNEELRRAQSELEESRDELRDLYDFAPVGYLTLGEDRVILRANLRAAALLGVERGALIGQRFTRFLARESQDAFYLYWAQSPEGPPQACDLLLRELDGTTVPIVMQTIEQKGPGPPAWRCAISDITARKHAEAKLRESEERYRQLAEEVTDGIFVADLQGRYLDANRAGCEMLGYTLEELNTLTLADVLAPDELKRLPEQFRGLATEAVVRNESHFRRKDGSVFIGELVGHQYPDGHLHYVLRDITERKRAEEAAKAHERTAAELAAMTNLHELGNRLLAAHDLKTALQEILAAACNVTKASKGNVQIFHPESNTLEIAAQQGFTQDFLDYFRVVRADEGSASARAMKGKRVIIEDVNEDETFGPHRETAARAGYRAVQSTPLLSRDGGLLGILSTHFSKPHRPSELVLRTLDLYARQAASILERIRAEATLRESEERFRTMADTAPVMIWVSGPETQDLFFNRPWLEFTGGTLEEEQKAGWMAGVHPEDVEHTRTIYSSAFEARRSFQMEFRLRRADGEYCWIVSNGAPRFAPDGVFGGYVASCIDVSDIKRAQEEVLAGQRLESLGVLASGVAHDFNNMIGGILANAELALSQSSAEESEKELQNIVSLAAHGGEIVRQLMTYGGVESQAAEPVSLSALIEEMIGLLNVSVLERVVLKTELDKTLPPVRANRSQLRQVVMNLVINASEAIGEGEGEVRIVTSRGKPGAQDRLPAGDYVRLEVSDTGGGMTPEVQARMFDPFFTTKFAGRGLGLAVIQRVIKRHKGEINVKSTPGEGTMFEILLPCADTGLKEKQIPAPGRAAGKQAGERTKQTGKVLMVEDAAALRSAVSEALRMQGFAVIEAGDGTAAVEEVRARADDIDIIVLDVMLPGIPSWEVLREARRLRPGIKIILMSAYSRHYVRKYFEGVAIDGFLEKPFALGDVLGVLRETLGKDD